MIAFSFTNQEIELLVNLLQTEYTEKRHELHYTDTAVYKQLLKEQLELIEGLRAKIESQGKEKLK